MGTPRRILCERRSYSDISYTHEHSFAQLILPLEGELFIKTNSFKLELDNQHLFFLPPGTIHTFHSKNYNQNVVLDIPLDIFYAGSIEQNNIEMYQMLDERWKAVRLLLLNETDTKNTALTDLIRYAFRFLQKEAIPKSIQYIHDHFDEKITVEKLASLEHFNVSYYCHWFYKKTGMSPNTYIQNIRLKKAKELLVETNLSLLQISHLVGYEHQSSLTRLFKKFEGISPRIYREKNL